MRQNVIRNSRGLAIPSASRTTTLPGAHGGRDGVVKRYAFASWLVLIGILIPAAEVQVYLGGAKFTAARLALVALIIPAVLALVKRGRHMVACDVVVILMVMWMVIAASVAPDSDSFSSAGAVSLEIMFSYFIGRAFFIGSTALDGFVRALKMVTIVIVTIALFEVITGRWLAHETAAALTGTQPLGAVFRRGVLRATSTLDHPILLGVFCALTNVIFLFWERRADRRFLSSFICLVGCLLSQSSAALMVYALGTCAYGYENVMRRVAMRWGFFWGGIGCVVAAVVLFTQNPIGWLISHLTLDPDTGYFRILIWNIAFTRIDQSPLFGHSFQMFGDVILDATIDCVWLIDTLRFGYPASALLLLANLTAIWPTSRKTPTAPSNTVGRMKIAFSVVLLLFMFSGLTVHFWNYLWIFWGLCIGIAASLREAAVHRGAGERTGAPGGRPHVVKTPSGLRHPSLSRRGPYGRS